MKSYTITATTSKSRNLYKETVKAEGKNEAWAMVKADLQKAVGGIGAEIKIEEIRRKYEHEDKDKKS